MSSSKKKHVKKIMKSKKRTPNANLLWKSAERLRRHMSPVPRNI